MTSPRLAAVRVLLAQEAGRVTLAAEIDRERPDLPDPRDRGLFMEIATGAVRWRAQIDACLAGASRRPPDQFAPEVRAILRAGAYQLLHLDRVPAHAVVHESVELTRAMKVSRASGFVNAVLRSVARAKRAGQLPVPPRPGDPADSEAALDYLSITLSHPRWLVARWLDRHGFEATARWCQFNNTPPDLTVRPLAAGDDVEEALRAVSPAASRAPFVPGAWRLPAGSLGRLPADLRARLFVQDEGAQLVALAAGAGTGDRVLDVCAAPGGKTLSLWQAVGPGGLVIAADYRASRVGLLRETLTRAGFPTLLVALDAERALPFGPRFDRVLLDVPCSGLGTIRRDPDIKWTRTEADVARLGATAGRMLEEAATAVAPGGALLYATCSPEPEEDEDVVDAFLSSTPGFRVEPIAGSVFGAQGRPMLTARGLLRTQPFRDGLDAFFAALLVRQRAA